MNAPSDVLAPVAAPVLFNAHKHHAGFLRARCEALAADAADDAGALSALSDELVVVGTSLMDWYTGALTPVVIAERLLAALDGLRAREEAAYREWIGPETYRTITLSDETAWCLRAGHADAPRQRYVHVHPGRWTPQTLRVRANTLRTAALFAVLAQRRGQRALLGTPESRESLALVNEGRALIGLSPMTSLVDGDRFLEMLRVLA